jgi:hypothetical protein
LVTRIQSGKYNFLIFQRIFSGKPSPCQGLGCIKTEKSSRALKKTRIFKWRFLNEKLKTPFARQDTQKGRSPARSRFGEARSSKAAGHLARGAYSST